MLGNYPDPFIDPRKKDKNYISEFIKQAYDENQRLYPNGFFRAKDKFHLIQQYMKGRQPVNKYFKSIDPLGQANPDQSQLKVDKSVLPIVPKFRRMAIEILGKKNYDLQADVIDPVAKDDRDKYYQQKRANITLKGELEKNGLQNKVPLLNMSDSDPQDIDELKMHMQYGYKNQWAREMETALKLVLENHNNFEKTREKIREDLFDYGAACIREYFDENGIIRVRKCDLPEVIVGFSKEENFSDTRYIGEIIPKTIEDIAKECNGELSTDQLKEVADKNHNSHRNPGSYNGDQYMKYRTNVLEMEFYSVNYLTLEKRTDKNGNKIVGRTKPRRSNNSKYTSSPYKVVYKGKWIVGTEYFYDCGLATDMKRDKNNLSETKLSYHMIAPGLYEMQTDSLGEKLIACADQIQIAWYRLQNVILRARPSGVAIELSSLENVPLGKGGSRLKPIEVLDLFWQRGDLVFRAIDDGGKALPYKPFEEMKNGIKDEAERWFGVINSYMDIIRDIIGFNEITDGSTPDPRTLKGVANLSFQSTNNSINYIHRAEKNLVQEVANDLTLRIHDRLGKGDISGYLKPLGSNTYEFMKVDKGATRYTYGVSIVDRPTDLELERLSARIEKAIDKEQITMADAVFVENFINVNVNMAEEILAYRVKKNLERKEQQQMEAIRINAEEQQKSTIVSETEKRKTEQMKHQFKMEEIYAKGQVDLQIEKAKNNTRLGEAMEITRRDLSKKQMEVDSQEYINEKKLSQ